MSKRLFASAVAGAMLVLSAVLVVSLIGGDDKPDITNEAPQDDEQLPDENQDDAADDEASDGDVETATDDSASDDDSDDEQNDAPDEDEEGSDGNGAKNGNCYEHKEAIAGSSQMNCENNFAEHVSFEDAMGDPKCECHGDDEVKGQSGK